VEKRRLHNLSFSFSVFGGLRVSHLKSRLFTTWATTQVHFVLVILEMGFNELFAWADFEINCSLPSS
jgi:hypothetical protein